MQLLILLKARRDMLMFILPNIRNSAAHGPHCFVSGLGQQYASDPGLFQAEICTLLVLLMFVEQQYPAIILGGKNFLCISILSFLGPKLQIFLNCLSRR